MPIIECNDKSTFDREIKNAKSKLVVIDFHATWCGPCKMIAPKYAEYSEKYKQQCVFLKVDVDKNKETAQDCKVEAMPTFVFFHEGRMIDTMKGADPGKLEQLIKKHADQYSKYAFKGPGNVLGAPTAGAAAAAAAAKPTAGAGAGAASSGHPRRNPWADPNFFPKSSAPSAPTTTTAKPATTSSGTSNPAAAAWANKDLSKPATPAATPATTTTAKPAATPAATPAPATTTAAPAATPATTTATPTPALAPTSTTPAPAATPNPATTTVLPAPPTAAPTAVAGHDPRLQVNAVLLQQLIDMGFSKIRSEKALILTKNVSVENAMNWLLEHESDADIDEPLQVVGTQSKVAGAPLGMQDDIFAAAEDLDDEAKKILMQARANANAKPSAAAPAASVSGEKKVTEMTSEEKMQWLAKKREERKIRLEKESIEKARVSERSRVAINKAAGDMKEKIEEEAAKAAYSLKKKEEKEKAEARRRVKEKLAADKERRKKEQEQLMAKIAAEKAAAANKK